MTPVAAGLPTRPSGYIGEEFPHLGTTSEVEIVALKRKLSVLLGAMTLAASLTACGSGGETDDGNSGDSSPTAEPTNDDGD